jgi:hypothetical protein
MVSLSFQEKTLVRIVDWGRQWLQHCLIEDRRECIFDGRTDWCPKSLGETRVTRTVLERVRRKFSFDQQHVHVVVLFASYVVQQCHRYEKKSIFG